MNKISHKYMRLAIELAKKALGKTSPNPAVGAVIVKNNKVVGKGYHKKAGLPHAEINALREAGQKARGATLYVTLSPCGHYGRTPPCTDAIIKSGIKKVIIAMKDPNPVNNGNGIKRLRRNGIKVEAGVLFKEAEAINKPYIKFITKGLPYITVKVAQSLDGKIATKTGDSKWISSEDSRRFVHELRGKVDAVMVGANTVLKDDPLLLSNVSRKQPVRIIVGGKSGVPRDAKIFSSLDRSPVIVVKSLSEALALKNMTHILVEGGGGLIASLVEKGLVDRFLIFIAPKIIGGNAAKTAVEGAGISHIKDASNFKIKSIRRFKKDILIEAEKE
ncbi:MAG: riboflavin biosynthesis protein RibD [Omnitrophica bacterium RIFCSPLOWO2_02_FULL_45_16]|nr:MAG: riboflavin biosynthesis protein RibD [Omnitrophica bacterium RIFCSPHIGHO2_02_FULL_46_20]OGW94206.1 MAG: riboflavin biosynthesis protein RibD [Omnitrophica bacterium RIFCSPLOWO2_01_FULL_45_24]OGX00679.1 MAG: riboflavin biosynthesis protein RibD [Omnitrophica bacterium RIFCSPLOWO2_02_FULL_45_16]